MEEIYIRPQAAFKKMKAAHGIFRTIYVYGLSGCGKTTFVEKYLGRRAYRYISANDMTAEALQVPVSDKKTIVVIDDVQFLQLDMLREQVKELVERNDIWLILIGRSPVPSWLMPAYLKHVFVLVEEQDLHFSKEMLVDYLDSWEIRTDEEMVDKILLQTHGNAMSIRMIALELARGVNFNEETLRQMRYAFWDYMDEHVFEQWDVELCEFLMQISIVDRFDIRLAEMITGESNVEQMLLSVKEIGNFLTEREGIYELFSDMRLGMRRRLVKQYTKEKRNQLYYNAGLYYEMSAMLPEALKMYEMCQDQTRISGLLVANARKSPGVANFYELRKYYLSLPEETIQQSVELMVGMCMLQSLLMNVEESERWYDCLKDYENRERGSRKRSAHSWVAYLNIAIPHRGSADMLDIIKNTSALIWNRKILLPEFSVTSNQPSIINGGKDFCEWSKRDTELAATIGKAVETVVGRFAKGIVDLALAESCLEKGGNNYEVSVLAGRGRMQAESGGKMELCFVGVNILAWLHVLTSHLSEAQELVENFYQKAEKEEQYQLLPNIRTLRFRLALYNEQKDELEKWALEAPEEEQDFYILDRYRYLAKVRLYLQQGKYERAIMLLHRIQYYAEVMKRTYIRMECRLLLAIAGYRLGNEHWKEIMQECLTQAEEYRFVRLISREGAAVLELLKKGTWEIKDKEFWNQVLEETEQMALAYPAYLKAWEESAGTIKGNALKILRLQADGMSNAQIATYLNITESTVKYHSRKTYKILGVTSKMDAVLEAKKRKLI